jgi:Holliday junction resolvase RusA-like endonuclease
MEQKTLFEDDRLIIKFQIPGNTPSKSNSYKIITMKGKGASKGHSSLAKTGALRDYEKTFYMCFPPQYRDLNLDHYFKISGNIYYPSNRSDLDNSLKIILDCLQRVTKTIVNDNKCVEITEFKRAVDKINPRIEITLTILKNL